MLPKNKALLDNARKLRQEMTPQERKLWYLFLRHCPQKIKRQHIIGPYIVDFYCNSQKLVIEIDGSQHYDDEGIAYDQKRTRYLNQLGLTVLRYSNADINCRFQEVCESIHQQLNHRR